MTHGTA